MFESNSTTVDIEPWFIPVDILLILFTSFTIILAVAFVSIIVLDRTCHTVPMMLIANTCLGVLMFSITRINMNAFSLKNDLQRIHHHYSSCIILAYLEYVSFGVQNYSFFQQGLYRCIVVVYPTRLFWQSARFQFALACLIWVFSFIYTIPYIVTGEIQYNAANQICQMPLRLSFLIVYNSFLVYGIPIGSMIFVYVKLVRYVKEMSQRVTPANTLLRAHRELKIVRRTIILITGVIITGFTYTIFILMSFFTSPPLYHFRIAYIFVDMLFAFLMIAVFALTEPLRASVTKSVTGRMNTVSPTVT